MSCMTAFLKQFKKYFSFVPLPVSHFTEFIGGRKHNN